MLTIRRGKASTKGSVVKPKPRLGNEYGARLWRQDWIVVRVLKKPHGT